MSCDRPRPLCVPSLKISSTWPCTSSLSVIENLISSPRIAEIHLIVQVRAPPPMSSALVCNLIHLEAKSGSLATPSAMTYVSLTLRCAPSPRWTGWRRHRLPCRNQSSWAVAVLSPPPPGSVRHAHDHPDKAASQSPQPADAMGERGTPHGFE
jgi:hypothetical protein